MSIDASYASPGLRWGLLLEDHPCATYRFELQSGEELGIPPDFGGRGDFCVATIEIPGHEPVQGYKALDGKKDPDQWNILCTKALGRALKRAGYPDKMPDLKALILWRQRNAEVQAITSGAVAELGPGQPDDVLDEAAVDEPDTDPDDEIVDAEIVEDGEGGATKAEPPTSSQRTTNRASGGSVPSDVVGSVVSGDEAAPVGQSNPGGAASVKTCAKCKQPLAGAGLKAKKNPDGPGFIHDPCPDATAVELAFPGAEVVAS